MDLQVALVLLAVGFAAFVKGFVGFGFPLISVPMLALLVDPRTAVIAVAIPTLLSNAFVLVRGTIPRKAVRRALPFVIPLVASAMLGASLLPRLDPRVLSLAIGAVSAVFAVLSLVRVNLKLTPAQERFASPAMGIVCGVTGGATSIYGPLVALYFRALGYDKWAFVYVVSLVFLLGLLAQNVTYATLGLYSAEAIQYGLLACVPTFVGVELGMRAQRLASLPFFDYAVLAVILLGSLNLVVRSLT